MAEGFSHGFTPGRDVTTDDPRMSRPWLQDAHHELLGRHVPRARVPQWPAVRLEPGFAKDRVLPTHFRAYTEACDGSLWVDTAPSYEEARYRLRLRLEDAGLA